MTCLCCQHDRKHAARGLCEHCYKRAYDLDMLYRYPRLYRFGTSKRAAYWREYKRKKREAAHG